eukprot:307141-Rhodomonas_salina.2
MPRADAKGDGRQDKQVAAQASDRLVQRDWAAFQDGGKRLGRWFAAEAVGCRCRCRIQRAIWLRTRQCVVEIVGVVHPLSGGPRRSRRWAGARDSFHRCHARTRGEVS